MTSATSPEREIKRATCPVRLYQGMHTQMYAFTCRMQRLRTPPAVSRALAERATSTGRALQARACQAQTPFQSRASHRPWSRRESPVRCAVYPSLLRRPRAPQCPRALLPSRRMPALLQQRRQMNSRQATRPCRKVMIPLQRPTSRPLPARSNSLQGLRQRRQRVRQQLQQR